MGAAVATLAASAQTKRADMAPRVLDGFVTVSEFPDTGANHLPAIRVACLISALMSNLVSFDRDKWPATPEALVHYYRDMVARKLMDAHGCTMPEGQQYITEVLHLQTIEPAAWHWHPGTQAEALLEGILAQAGINGLILQLARAGRMPTSEPGVNGHYVAIGGVKIVGGVVYVLVGNGDDVLCLGRNKGHGKVLPARWLSWQQVLMGVPAALLAIVHPVKPSTVGTPSGWHDDQTTQLLTAPNSNVMEKGFRAFVLAYGKWDPNWQPLMRHEVGSPSGSFLVCNGKTLEWSPQHGVTVRDTGPADLYYARVATMAGAA